MVSKFLCIPLLWTNVFSALEGLMDEIGVEPCNIFILEKQAGKFHALGSLPRTATHLECMIMNCDGSC